MYEIIEQAGPYGILVVLLWQQVQNMRTGKKYEIFELKKLLKDSDGIPISTTLKHLSRAVEKMTSIHDRQTEIMRVMRDDVYEIKRGIPRSRRSTPPNPRST